MITDWQLLVGRYLADQEDVAGLTEVALPLELRSKLERFVAGRCEISAQSEIFEALRTNPASVRWLADEVKRRRVADKGLLKHE